MRFGLSLLAVCVALSLLVVPASAQKKDPKELPLGMTFEQEVNQAIDKGVAYLKSRQKDDGSWNYKRGGFEPGNSALCLLALASSGVQNDDKVIERGFAYVLKHPLQKTYTVAVTIMALEAAFCHRKPSKHFTQSQADLKPHRAKLLELLKWLLKQYRLDQKGWRYPGGGVDNSHIQYAMLALKAACRCGYSRYIPLKLWKDLMRVTIERQEKTGPLVKDIGTLEVKNQKSGSVEVKTWKGGYKGGAQARGWNYNPLENKDPATGSMTSAGVAILVIARSERIRRRDASFTKKEDAKCKRGIEDGLAWLAKNFTVHKNPEHPRGEWHYYYLYGLERVGVFLDLKAIGGHDWYKEGAKYLLSKQSRNGSWDDEEKTCYALLFLKRATTPPQHGRGSVARY